MNSLLKLLLCLVALYIAYLLVAPYFSLQPGSQQTTLDASVLDITSTPQLSVAQLNMILDAYHSAMAGLGQYIYDEGRQYQISSDHAMAWWLRESALGTSGEARRTLSPGNLRCIPERACIDWQRGGFAKMRSWKDGIDQWYALMHFGYVEGRVTKPLVGHACTTLTQIVPVYAPARDNNNEQAYINGLIHAIVQWRAGKVVVQ